MTIPELLLKYREGLVAGLWVTVYLCIIIWSSGIILGSALGIAGARWRRTVAWPSHVFSFLLAGTPAILLLFYIHYPVQSMLRIVIDPFYTAAIALSLYMVVSVADAVREAIIHFPRQHIWAAQVCGLTRRQVLTRIQAPLITRQLLPSVLTFAVVALQSTLFASFIGVQEVFRVAQSINSWERQPVVVYSLVAVVFLAVCLPLHGLALGLQRRHRRDLSER